MSTMRKKGGVQKSKKQKKRKKNTSPSVTDDTKNRTSNNNSINETTSSNADGNKKNDDKRVRRFAWIQENQRSPSKELISERKHSASIEDNDEYEEEEEISLHPNTLSVLSTIAKIENAKAKEYIGTMNQKGDSFLLSGEPNAYRGADSMLGGKPGERGRRGPSDLVEKENQYKLLKQSVDTTVESLERSLDLVNRRRATFLSHNKDGHGVGTGGGGRTSKSPQRLISHSMFQSSTANGGSGSGSAKSRVFQKLRTAMAASSQLEEDTTSGLSKVMQRAAIDAFACLDGGKSDYKQSWGTKRTSRDKEGKNIQKTSQTHNNSTTESEEFFDKETRYKLWKKEAKRREKRALENRLRREELEKKRKDEILSRTASFRRAKLKEEAVERSTQSGIVRGLCECVMLAASAQALVDFVKNYREEKERSIVENRAAIVISRNVRLYCFRHYRERVKGAVRSLASAFVVKMRMWRAHRRRVASDTIREFLLSLEVENKKTGGCLELIIKGKKWKAYRQKIIIVQRRWRVKLAIILAQVALIDRQWQREQNKLTDDEIEYKFKEGEAAALEANDNIDTINRTRKLMKMRPLPRKKAEGRSAIRRKLINGSDLLSIGNIVPMEIRCFIIRETLKHAKRMHMIKLEKFRAEKREYEAEVQLRKRRGAMLAGFAGDYMAKICIKAEEKCATCGIENIAQGKRESFPALMKESFSVVIPDEPHFKTVLEIDTLNLMMKLGAQYVGEVRSAWTPANISFVIPTYESIGAEVAMHHIQFCNNDKNKIETYQYDHRRRSECKHPIHMCMKDHHNYLLVKTKIYNNCCDLLRSLCCYFKNTFAKKIL